MVLLLIPVLGFEWKLDKQGDSVKVFNIRALTFLRVDDIILHSNKFQ